MCCLNPVKLTCKRKAWVKTLSQCNIFCLDMFFAFLSSLLLICFFQNSPKDRVDENKWFNTCFCMYLVTWYMFPFVCFRIIHTFTFLHIFAGLRLLNWCLQLYWGRILGARTYNITVMSGTFQPISIYINGLFQFLCLLLAPY